MNIEKRHLTINPYSRPGELLNEVKAVVMHWVANPGTSAEANRNFFESRKTGEDGYGSAHYIVGLQGEIIQCIPPTEAAWHVGSKTYTRFTHDYLTNGNPNYCTVGIELCHQGWDGSFGESTLFSAAELVASLCENFKLNPYRDITTHKAVVGWKNCPKYWCEHPDEFQRFQRMVARRMGL